MVKSIKLATPAIAMSSKRFPKIASAGSSGVSVGRQIPINDVLKAINLITSKESLNDNRIAAKHNALGHVQAVPVQHSAYDANINSSSVNVSGDSRAKIIDNTSRQLAQIIVSQLEALRLQQVHSNNHHTASVLPSVSASVEQLLNWADHSLKQINRQPVSLFSLNRESPFTTTLNHPSFLDSDLAFALNNRKDVSSNSFSSSSVVNNFVSSRVPAASSGLLLEDVVSLIDMFHDSASMSSHTDHTKRFALRSRIVSGESFKIKDKGVNALYGETKGMSFNLGGLVEDSYGSGPLRYQQDMENGPPTSTHSSNPRELGES